MADRKKIAGETTLTALMRLIRKKLIMPKKNGDLAFRVEQGNGVFSDSAMITLYNLDNKPVGMFAMRVKNGNLEVFDFKGNGHALKLPKSTTTAGDGQVVDLSAYREKTDNVFEGDVQIQNGTLTIGGKTISVYNYNPDGELNAGEKNGVWVKIDNLEVDYLNIGGLTVSSINFPYYMPATIYFDDGIFKMDHALSVFGDITSTNNINAAAFYQTSDERLKDKVGDLDLERCKSLMESIPAMLYKLKTDEDGEVQIGTSAQAVQKVMPELVFEDHKGRLALAYDRMTIVCLELLKDAYKQIDELRTEVEELKVMVG